MNRNLFRLFIIFVIWTWSPGPVRAQDAIPQKQPAELIPAPLPQPQPLPLYVPHHEVIIIPQPRPGTREVWSSYGIDSTGRFRPRIIVTPYGGVNQQTLQPYPWLTYNPRLYIPR